MPNLQQIVYLSAAEYNTLVTNGTLTKNGRTITYDENNLYITPETAATSLAHSITFGSNQNYTFDGTADVVVPVYTGTFL